MTKSYDCFECALEGAQYDVSNLQNKWIQLVGAGSSKLDTSQIFPDLKVPADVVALDPDFPRMGPVPVFQGLQMQKTCCLEAVVCHFLCHRAIGTV